MANTFKNAYYDVTASLLPAYTAPSSAGNVAIVLTLRITNVDGANDATVDAEIVDNGGSEQAYIAYELSCPADTTVELAGTSKLVLEAGDTLKLKASSASDLEAFISVLQIT